MSRSGTNRQQDEHIALVGFSQVGTHGQSRPGAKDGGLFYYQVLNGFQAVEGNDMIVENAEVDDIP